MLLANLWVLIASAVSVSPYVIRDNFDVDPNTLTTFLSQLASSDDRVDAKVQLNYQNMASKAHFDHDNAPKPLFTSVDPAVLQRPTFTSLQNLMKFYQADATVAENRTPSWNTAISDFLDDVLNTNVMKTAQNFLYNHGMASNDLQTFKEQVTSIWFTLFSRNGGVPSSSGFKSLFFGEETSGKVVSFNNWVQFYLQENAGLINYHGWFTKENVSFKVIFII
ncbi:unnamed protein product [Auanema sp. JU1783]|nr:unnamed protein product [Auanema sp. JU1783]